MRKYFKSTGKEKPVFYFRPLNKLYEKYAGRKKKNAAINTALAQSLIWGAGTGLTAGLLRLLFRKSAERYAASYR